jgi:hypothetical protein
MLSVRGYQHKLSSSPETRETMPRRDWNRDELIVAFNLYCRTPFGRIHNRNPDITWLANALGRSPSSVSWKLANFARLDPALRKRNIRGASHGSKAEEEIWHEFSNNWDSLAFESEQLLLKLAYASEQVHINEVAFPEGKTRDALVKTRVNQSFFRSAVLAAYNSKCCITGLALPAAPTPHLCHPFSAGASDSPTDTVRLCLRNTGGV